MPNQTPRLIGLQSPVHHVASAPTNEEPEARNNPPGYTTSKGRLPQWPVNSVCCLRVFKALTSVLKSVNNNKKFVNKPRLCTFYLSPHSRIEQGLWCLADLDSNPWYRFVVVTQLL